MRKLRAKLTREGMLDITGVLAEELSKQVNLQILKKITMQSKIDIFKKILDL